MSFALADLRRLVQQDDALIGVVVSVDGALVRIATAKGAFATRTDGSISRGDRVLVRNGIASAAPVAKRCYSV